MELSISSQFPNQDFQFKTDGAINFVSISLSNKQIMIRLDIFYLVMHHQNQNTSIG